MYSSTSYFLNRYTSNEEPHLTPPTHTLSFNCKFNEEPHLADPIANLPLNRYTSNKWRKYYGHRCSSFLGFVLLCAVGIP